jgi:cytoskeletal protein CcmA (bactofilin family)
MSFFNSRAKSPAPAGSLPDKGKSAPAGQEVSCLGKGTTIHGTVSFGGSARIDGLVDGEIIATGTLVIGETATITARIKTASLIVAGKVFADITASERIVIEATAQVQGKLCSPMLTIHAGGSYDGDCKIARIKE